MLSALLLSQGLKIEPQTPWYYLGSQLALGITAFAFQVPKLGGAAMPTGVYVSPRDPKSCPCTCMANTLAT